MSSAISLAESFLQSGNVAAAYKVLKDFPEPTARYHLMLARCATRLNDFPAAIAALGAALAQEPKHVEAALQLGELYMHLGWLDKADAHFSKFLKKQDDDRVRVQYGRLQYRRGRSAAALAEWARVLARDPRNFQALVFRADTLATSGKREEALRDYRLAVTLRPESAEIWGRIGIAEIWRGEVESAVVALKEASRLAPDDSDVLFPLAQALTVGGHIDEARRTLNRLREVDPARWRVLKESTSVESAWGDGNELDPRPFFLHYAFEKLMECDWSFHRGFGDVFRDFLHEPEGNPMPLVHASGAAPLNVTERLQLAELAGKWTGAGIAERLHAPTPSPARLRIAYALPHLGAHVVAQLIERLVLAHDQAAVEIFLVALNMIRKDYESATFTRLRDMPGVTLVDVTGMGDEAAAAKIHALGLDVLVDLAVYNDQPRPRIFAWRPAPVQVNWLGATYSSGARWLDYIITDPVASPGTDGWCSEAEVRMPGCYFAFGAGSSEPPVPLSRAEAGLPEKKFVFSALHSAYKLEPVTFDRWLRILQAAPESVLWLRDGERLRSNLTDYAASRGVEASRLVFAGKVPGDIYLARQGAPDLFLDTRIYNGHTTMAESLWSGVPGLSCPGDSFQNRVGASLLASCGLDELIVSDWDQYEAMAVALYHDRPRLQRIRERLAASRGEAAPFDMKGQAAALEKAYRHMRQRFADGLAPASFDIASLP
ncbi:MAG TPA: tetratricopeptide repeat protein [Moraxellaceae bacterium]|nr:tetratricopeptide repeat protein [Moraxellaceae bacterium]